MLNLVGISTRSELLNTVLKSVGICCVEALTYAWMYGANVLRSSRLLKELNFMTLEGVLYAYQKHQQLMKICYSHFFFTELTEITVCVLLSVYDIVAPVWSQEGTWYSLTDYYSVRRWNIVVIFLVRLGIQVYGANNASDKPLPASPCFRSFLFFVLPSSASTDDCGNLLTEHGRDGLFWH